MPSVAGPGVAGLVFVVHALRRARMRTPLNSAPLVAIWAADAPAGSRAMLVFEVAEMPSPTEGDGTLVGECGLNGALCLELGDGTVLWPTYNPRPPMTEVRR